MICFKDMSFCASDCTRSDCHRFFGEKQRDAAKKWWGDLPGSAPVAFCDFSKDCPDYQRSE